MMFDTFSIFLGNRFRNTNRHQKIANNAMPITRFFSKRLS